MKNLIAILITSLFIVGMGTNVFAGNDDEKNESKETNATMTTSLNGQVVDQNTGESLTGVKVEIKGADKEAYTDFEGNFNIAGIRPGEYELVASYISYRDKVYNDVKLELDENNKLTLKLESIEE
jgi:protocatechuate 3,4-dioxygenase beta subunit